MGATFSTSADGTRYRDLNRNGVMDPYEDPRRPITERVNDLVGRLSIQEKAGLMVHAIVSVTVDGDLSSEPIAPGRSDIRDLVADRLATHINVHRIPDPRSMARWANEVQALAEQSKHGIPVTISTDPRHSFTENWGASFSSEHLSAWPEPLGLGAIGDPDVVREFADIARREYVALGIRSALHPTMDVATEPRWARQYSTFGQNATLVGRLGIAYADGFEGRDGLRTDGVACMAKHFPGGGPQRDGEDPQFVYGREQVYPGGMFEYHLEPFRRLIERGVSAVMPSYGVPVGLIRNGQRVEDVGFGFNRQILTELLREELGFNGVICSDWGLISASKGGGKVLPPRSWGVESLGELDRTARVLDAGCDQLGGEEHPEWIVELVESGRMPMERVDESVRRLLEVKFRLGLFDDPYVEEDRAEEIVGSEEFRAAGHRAQVASTTVLAGGSPSFWPLSSGTRVHSDEVSTHEIESAGLVPVTDPRNADIAIMRVTAPYEPRDEYWLEASFHAGSLEFAPPDVDRVKTLAQHAPVILIVHLERPAILEPLLDHAAMSFAVYGASDRAVLEVLTGRGRARGAMPFDVPRDVASVVAHRPDVPGGYENVLFRAGTGSE